MGCGAELLDRVGRILWRVLGAAPHPHELQPHTVFMIGYESWGVAAVDVPEAGESSGRDAAAAQARPATQRPTAY
jgi:hypothetical protein